MVVAEKVLRRFSLLFMYALFVKGKKALLKIIHVISFAAMLFSLIFDGATFSALSFFVERRMS